MAKSFSVPALERVKTGVPGLDTVLQGGLVRSGVYVLQGPPGIGKTTLTSQIAYQHARQGGSVLYTTLLSETHGRLLQHLGAFRFFDPALVGKSIAYLSGFPVLESEGLRGLVTLLRRETRARKATLLVLDGLIAAGDSAKSATEFKKFIYELQVHSELNQCTVLLLTSGLERGRPELTMVDGILRLGYVRSDRVLRVRKMRGSGTLKGAHSFQIDSDGITLFPRTEVLYARPEREPTAEDARVGTGIARLDQMIGGGWPMGSTTLLLGPSGTGKTTAGLQFLSQSSKAEPGLLFGFYESPQSLFLKASRLGLKLEELHRRGAVKIVWQPTTGNILDSLGHRLLSEVRANKVRRLFVDGLGGFKQAAPRKLRLNRFFAALSHELRALEVTTLYSQETRNLIGTPPEPPLSGISEVAENLVLLRFFEQRSQLHRIVSVLKVRDSEFDSALHLFRIGKGGIQIEAGPERTEAILSGARLPARRPTRRRR